MHQLRCEIAIALNAPKPAAPKPPPGKQPAPKKAPPPPEPAPVAIDWRAACKKASELAQGDPSPHVSVAVALVRAKDLKGAREELVLAEGKIANLANGADAWRKILGIYVGLDLLTWAEQAIEKAKLEKDPAAAQIAQRRARYGVPKGAKFVTPDKEGQLVAAVRTALDLVYASKYADAERALAAIEKQWPGASGIYATRCDLGMRNGSIDAARASCARALAIDPGNSWALYLSGVISLKSAAGTPQGIDMLKKAIAVDPELGQAWRTLGKAYVRSKDKASYEQLAKDYQAKFGSPLPP
jgi:tetratricopeptide (TPR) repeat protein